MAHQPGVSSRNGEAQISQPPVQKLYDDNVTFEEYVSKFANSQFFNSDRCSCTMLPSHVPILSRLVHMLWPKTKYLQAKETWTARQPRRRKKPELSALILPQGR